MVIRVLNIVLAVNVYCRHKLTPNTFAYNACGSNTSCKTVSTNGLGINERDC